MSEFSDILAAKIKHYGSTEAAFDFAADQYARIQCRKQIKACTKAIEQFAQPAKKNEAEVCANTPLVI